MVLTLLWSVGDCVTSSWLMCMNIFSAPTIYFCNEMLCFNALLSASKPLLLLCLLHLLICTYLKSSPNACPPYLCYIDVYAVCTVQQFYVIFYVYYFLPDCCMLLPFVIVWYCTDLFDVGFLTSNMSNPITIGHFRTLLLLSLFCWPLFFVISCAFAHITTLAQYPHGYSMNSRTALSLTHCILHRN